MDMDIHVREEGSSGMTAINFIYAIFLNSFFWVKATVSALYSAEPFESRTGQGKSSRAP